MTHDNTHDYMLSRAYGWDPYPLQDASGPCSQELQVNEEYVEKETEFDVNEDDEQPPVKCVHPAASGSGPPLPSSAPRCSLNVWGEQDEPSH